MSATRAKGQPMHMKKVYYSSLAVQLFTIGLLLFTQGSGLPDAVLLSLLGAAIFLFPILLFLRLLYAVVVREGNVLTLYLPLLVASVVLALATFASLLWSVVVDLGRLV